MEKTNHPVTFQPEPVAPDGCAGLGEINHPGIRVATSAFEIKVTLALRGVAGRIGAGNRPRPKLPLVGIETFRRQRGARLGLGQFFGET